MDIAIPVAPLGVLTLLGFFGPYAVGALNGALAFVKNAWQKKLVSIGVSLVLAAIVVVFYYAITGDPITNWWLFALLAIVIVNASYALVTRSSASAVERAADPNTLVVQEASREIGHDQTIIDAAQQAVEVAEGSGTAIVSLSGYVIHDGEQLPRPKFGLTILFPNGLRIDSDGIAHLPESSPDGVDGNGLTYFSVGSAR